MVSEYFVEEHDAETGFSEASVRVDAAQAALAASHDLAPQLLRLLQEMGKENMQTKAVARLLSIITK